MYNLKQISILIFSMTLLLLMVTCSYEKASASQSFCVKHPVFCHIIKNNPRIDRNYAMELSNIIHRLAKDYNINPLRLSAILATESQYKLNAVNSKSKDYGISQINEKTAESYNFCKDRLLTDLEYSVKAGVIVLADFKKRYAHKEKNWYCRYNVGTGPENKIADRCEQYIDKVIKYL